MRRNTRNWWSAGSITWLDWNNRWLVRANSSNWTHCCSSSHCAIIRWTCWKHFRQKLRNFGNSVSNWALVKIKIKYRNVRGQKKKKNAIMKSQRDHTQKSVNWRCSFSPHNYLQQMNIDINCLIWKCWSIFSQFIQCSCNN